MKAKPFVKTKSLLIVCCAAAALAFLMGVVDDSYARDGFARGGVASDGGFSRAAVAPARDERVGVGGPVGVGGGPAHPAAITDVARRHDNVAGASNTVDILPCMADVITVEEVTYYSCGTEYYTQSFSDGSVVYVQSEPPPGY